MLFVSIVVSMKINRRHYFQSDLLTLQSWYFRLISAVTLHAVTLTVEARGARLHPGTTIKQLGILLSGAAFEGGKWGDPPRPRS